MFWSSLPTDVLWGSFVTHSFLPHGPWGRNECVTNASQRKSAGRLVLKGNENCFELAEGSSYRGFEFCVGVALNFRSFGRNCVTTFPWPGCFKSMLAYVIHPPNTKNPFVCWLRVFLMVVLRRRRFYRNDDLSITSQCRQPKLNRLSTRSVNASCSYVIPVPLFSSPPSPYSYNPRCTPPRYIWKSRWRPLTVRSVIFRRSHEKIGDCEQSNCSREMLISKPIQLIICGGRHLIIGMQEIQISTAGSPMTEVQKGVYLPK